MTDSDRSVHSAPSTAYSGVWRNPGECTSDYPGLEVHDGRQTGSIWCSVCKTVQGTGDTMFRHPEYGTLLCLSCYRNGKLFPQPAPDDDAEADPFNLTERDQWAWNLGYKQASEDAAARVSASPGLTENEWDQLRFLLVHLDNDRSLRVRSDFPWPSVASLLLAVREWEAGTR